MKVPFTTRTDPVALGSSVPGFVAAAVVGLVTGAAASFGAPAVFLLAAGSLFAFLLARYGMSVMTLAFVFLVYANVPVVATQFHGVPPFAASAIIVLVAVPVTWFLLGERKPIVLPPAFPAVALYVAVAFTSAIWARSVAGTTEALWILLTEGLLLYLLITNAIRTRAVLVGALWMVVAAAALMAGLALLQEITGTYGRTFGGFAQTSGAFTAGDGPLRPRPAGAVGETNRFAQVLIVSFPLAIGLARSAASRRQALAALGAAGVILGGTIVTFSRGAAVAFVVLVVAMAMLRLIAVRHLIVVGLTCAALVVIVAPAMIERVSSLGALESLAANDESGVDGAILGRATSNLAALNVFLDHSGVGVGPGQYAPLYSREYANELGLKHFPTTRRAHNLYLETAAETGLLGLLALAALIGATVVTLLRARWRAAHPTDATIAAALLLAVGAYLLTATFLHLSYQRYFWLLFALAHVAPTVFASGRASAKQAWEEA